MGDLPAYLVAILALGLAVILRLHTSRKEASEQITTLQRKLIAPEQRIVELERAQKRTEESPQLKTRPDISIFPENFELTVRLQLFAQHERETAKAYKRLNAMKAELTFEDTVEEKYVAELSSIVMSLEKASGRDLSRWLGMSSQEKQAGVWAHDRDSFRLTILSLLAFCTYQNYHPQLPIIFSTQTSRLIH